MVIPRPIKGKYRSLKNYAKWSLLALLLSLPFIHVAGRPLILLDIPARKFHIFGLIIWPQEMYFLHVLLLTGGVLLFFVTALWGRIWCTRTRKSQPHRTWCAARPRGTLWWPIC